MVVETAASQKLDFYEKVITDLEENGELTPKEIAATLAFLVQRDRPLLVTPNKIPETNLGDRSNDRGDRGNDRNSRGKREHGDRTRENNDRNQRSDRGDRNSDRGNDRSRHTEGSGRKKGPTQPGMVTYRLDVGKEHGAQARHIVGAIANEAGVESQYIQNIDINDGHSTVDLPEGMPKEIENHLQKVRVMGQQLSLRKISGKDEGQKDTKKK